MATDSPYSIDKAGLSKQQKDTYESNQATSVDGRAVSRGFFQDEKLQPVPNRIISPSERVITNSGYRNNAFIVLGRDRPASFGSGYGATGVNGAAAIDICVGMMAGAKTGAKSDADVHPNFATDAARIYISEKTDIDHNFGLAQGRDEKLIANATKARSAIGIKADGVRIIARKNGIKLVTGKGNFSDTGDTGERDSTSNTIIHNAGKIELIAGNDTTEISISDILTPALKNLLQLFSPIKMPDKIRRLQPIPKGDNLVLCFKLLLNIVDSLMVKINVLSSILMEFMVAVPPALIPLPGSAALGAVSGVQIARLFSEVFLGTNPVSGPIKQKINAVSNTYLEPYGMFYINSRYCSTT